MALEWPQHDPTETLDYFVDWTFFLEGDIIASSTFDILTVVDENQDQVDDALIELVRTDHTDHFAGVWITGGVPGHRAAVRNTVVTNGGRTIVQTVMLPIGAN